LIILEQVLQGLRTPAIRTAFYCILISHVYSKVQVSKEEFDHVVFELVNSSFFFVKESIIDDLTPLVYSFEDFRLAAFKMAVTEGDRGVIKVEPQYSASFVSSISSKSCSHFR
jgi:hypothetical protein